MDRIERNDVFVERMMASMLGVRLAQPFAGYLVIDPANPTIPRGMFVINDVANGNAELSAVGKKCWSVPVVRAVARMLFHDMHVTRVTARTRPSNQWAMRALKAMGFVREGTARHWYRDGEDAAVFGLLASEQRIVK